MKVGGCLAARATRALVTAPEPTPTSMKITWMHKVGRIHMIDTLYGCDAIEGFELPAADKTQEQIECDEGKAGIFGV